jgi:long-chain acyl-CoA synthetase
VLEAAVIGVPDPQWGEALKAVIVVKNGAEISTDQLLGFCKEKLSSYKVPKSMVFAHSLPHTEVGKVNKVKLREIILAGGKLGA